jgi:hypothetical protein
MKNRIEDSITDENAEVIATFGEARLLKVNETIVLQGGSMADRTEALEWLAMFRPESVTGVGR